MDNLSNEATTMCVNDITHLVMNTGKVFHSLTILETERDKLKTQCISYRNKLKNANRLLIKTREDQSGEVLERTKKELDNYINMYHTCTQEKALAQSECKKAQENLQKEQKKNQKISSKNSKNKLCHQYQDKILELQLEINEWKGKHDEISQRLNRQNQQSKASIMVKREEYKNTMEELKSLRTNYSVLIGENKRLKERDKMLQQEVENFKLENLDLTQKIELQSQTMKNLSTSIIMQSPKSTTSSSSYIEKSQNFINSIDKSPNCKRLDLNVIDVVEDEQVESQNLERFGLSLIDENIEKLQISDEPCLTSKNESENKCEQENKNYCGDDSSAITQDQIRQILDEMIHNRPTCLSPMPPSPSRTPNRNIKFSKLEVEEETKKLIQTKEENNKFNAVLTEQQTKLNGIKVDITNAQHNFNEIIENQTRNCTKIERLENEQKKFNLAKLDVIETQKKVNLMIEELKAVQEQNGNLKVTLEKVLVKNDELCNLNGELFSKKKIDKTPGLTAQQIRVLAQKVARKEIRTHLMKKNATIKAKLKKERNVLIGIGFKRGRRSRLRLRSGINDPILDEHCGQRSVDSGYIISDNECDNFETEHEEMVNTNIPVDAQLPRPGSSNKKNEAMPLVDAAPVELSQDTISDDDVKKHENDYESEVKESNTKNYEKSVIFTKMFQNGVFKFDNSGVNKTENKPNVTNKQINIKSYYIFRPSSDVKETLPVKIEVGNVKTTDDVNLVEQNRGIKDYLYLNNDDVCNKPVITKAQEKIAQDLQDLLDNDLNLSESDSEASIPKKQNENVKELRREILQKTKYVEEVQNLIPHQSLECEENRNMSIVIKLPSEAAIQNTEDVQNLLDNDLNLSESDSEVSIPKKQNENVKELRREILQKTKYVEEVQNLIPHQSLECEENRNMSIVIKLPSEAAIQNTEDVQNKVPNDCSIGNKVRQRSIFDVTDESDSDVSLIVDVSDDSDTPEIAHRSDTLEEIQHNGLPEIDCGDNNILFTTLLSKTVVKNGLNEIQKDCFLKSDDIGNICNKTDVTPHNIPSENNFYLNNKRKTPISNILNSKMDNINTSTTLTLPEKNIEVFKHVRDETSFILNKNCAEVTIESQNGAPKWVNTNSLIATKPPGQDIENFEHLQDKMFNDSNLGRKSNLEAATKSQKQAIENKKHARKNIESLRFLFDNESDDSDVPLTIANEHPLKEDFCSWNPAKTKIKVNRVLTDDSDDSDTPLSIIRRNSANSTKESLPKKKLGSSQRKRCIRDQIGSARKKLALAVKGNNKIVIRNESLSCKSSSLSDSLDTEGPDLLPIYRTEPACNEVLKEFKGKSVKRENVNLSNLELAPRRSPRNLGINHDILNILKIQSQQQGERTYKRPNCWANQKNTTLPKKIEKNSISVEVEANLLGFDKNGQMVLSSSESDDKVVNLSEKDHKCWPKFEIKNKGMLNKWTDLPSLPVISPQPQKENEDFRTPKIVPLEQQSKIQNKSGLKDEKTPELYHFTPQTFKSEDFPLKFKQEKHEIKFEMLKQEVDATLRLQKVPTNYKLIEKALLMLFEVPSDSMINILLSNYEIKPLCRVIVKLSTEDIECKPVKRENAIAPILSEYQIVLLRLLIAMTRKDDSTKPIFFKIAERALLTIETPIHLEPLARLHVAYMKYFHQFVHAKSFIFCSLAKMGNLAVPYLYFLATSWSEVFVKYQDASENDRLLMRAMITLLMSKELREPEYYKIPLISFLTQIQGFPSDVVPITHMLKQIITEYLEKRWEELKIMILIIARNLSGPAFYNQFVSNLKLKQFQSETDFDVALDLLNFLICNFKELNQKTLRMIIEWLSVLLQSSHSENFKKKLIMIKSKFEALY